MSGGRARTAASLRAGGPLEELGSRRLLTAVFVGALLWSLLEVEWSGGLLRANGLGVLGRSLAGLLRPDLSPGVLALVARASLQTLVYAVAGLSLALVLAFPLGVLASGALVKGRARVVSLAAGRTLLAALRSVHELVWAWLFVAAVGLSPLAAVLALALPYAGILGRIWADLLDEVPAAPLRSLRVGGAGEAAVLVYGRLPMAAPDMVAYAFYRFECAIRASAIMGFVGVGGVGLQIQLALQDLRYGVVSTLLLALVALVVGIEAWSAAVRREMAA